MGDLFDSPWKILIIVVVILVLFGSAKLPVFARSLGKSMRILKKEVSGLHEDDEDDKTAATTTVTTAPAQLQAPAQPAASSADAQAQIDALGRQLADLQQSVKTSDGAQAK
jgi:sec-independent protein translocase protein TatA